MNLIVGFIACALGFLMDFFFQGLTLVGYPRLWACIVLFAIATRFLFLPKRIKNYKKRLLTPVVNRELLQADPNFFEKTKDKELIIERSAFKKEVYKKYKLNNRFGWLMTIVQYLLLFALFYVVKNPQEFIPSLESLANASANVTTFLGVSLSTVPLENFGVNGASWFILSVPFLVMASNVAKMFKSLKLAKTKSQKIKVYSLCVFFTLLLGWFSTKLPLAISLYWITNDLTYGVFDYFIQENVPKGKFVSAVIKEYKEQLLQDKLKKEAEAVQAADSKETEASADSCMEATSADEPPVPANEDAQEAGCDVPTEAEPARA